MQVLAVRAVGLLFCLVVLVLPPSGISQPHRCVHHSIVVLYLGKLHTLECVVRHVGSYTDLPLVCVTNRLVLCSICSLDK